MEGIPSTADYLVGPLIGEGSFAQVYFGKHKQSSRLVAIKVIDQVTVRKNPKFLKAILQEQTVLSTTLHDVDCVARLRSSFYDSNCLYLILELCEGGDLQYLIHCHAKSGLDSDWIASIPQYLHQIQEAIDALHSLDIVHGDIKPANILLTLEGKVKLTDLGSAMDLSRGTPNLQDCIRGTTEYSAPELIRNDYCSLPKAIDYWSFGCVAITMYTGSSPFHRDGSDYLTVQAILETNDDSQSSLWGTCFEISEQLTYIDSHHKDYIVHLLLPFRGLLQVVPTKRVEAWISLRSEIVTNAPTGNPDDMILPRACWTEEVKSCGFKDGALGWVLFL